MYLNAKGMTTSGPVLVGALMLKASPIKRLPHPLVAAYTGKAPLVARDVMWFQKKQKTIREIKCTERDSDRRADCETA